MAITAFCHSQKPLIQALHDNVGRVYGKAARELSSWTRQKIASGSEAAAPGQVLQPAAAQPVSVALSASGSLKRVRASAPDENLLMCNENMGDDA